MRHVLVVLAAFFALVSCRRSVPEDERPGREALGEHFDELREARGGVEARDRLVELVRGGDPFVASSALERAASWHNEDGRRVLVAGALSGSSLIRERAVELLLRYEDDRGGPASPSWADTVALLVGVIRSHGLQRAVVERFARMMASDGHDTVRQAIEGAAGQGRDRLFALLCSLDLDDEDVKFLIRHADSIGDEAVYATCDARVRKATFGKKSLARGAK